MPFHILGCSLSRFLWCHGANSVRVDTLYQANARLIASGLYLLQFPCYWISISRKSVNETVYVRGTFSPPFSHSLTLILDWSWISERLNVVPVADIVLQAVQPDGLLKPIVCLSIYWGVGGRAGRSHTPTSGHVYPWVCDMAIYICIHVCCGQSLIVYSSVKHLHMLIVNAHNHARFNST